MEVPQIRDQTVEVARVIPQERIKPAGANASVRERVRQFEMNGVVSRTSTVEVPRVAPDGRQSEDPEDEAPKKRRKQESNPGLRAPVTEGRLVMEVYTSHGVCVHNRSLSDFWCCDEFSQL